MMRAMLSVVIPTLNAEETLTRTLAPLVPAAVRGLVQEVIVVDGGSRDDTVKLIPLWKAEHEWLTDGHAQAMQEALNRLDLAFRAFWFGTNKLLMNAIYYGPLIEAGSGR